MTDLHTLRTALAAEIAANRAAMRKLDRIDRGRLLPFTDRLAHVLNRIETARPHEEAELALLLGPDMRGPKIADWISQSQRIRAGAEAHVSHSRAA